MYRLFRKTPEIQAPNHAPDIAAMDLFVVPTIASTCSMPSSSFGWSAETLSGSTSQPIRPRTGSQDERRSLSYHEAGHAVVAWSLGFRVSKVSIGMDGNDGPVTELDAVLPPRPSQALIINRGGMAAEDLFDALTSSRARLTDRYQADHEILKRLKRKKCEAKRDAYHRARKLLEANKEQAIKVAEYLIEHGKIDGVAAPIPGLITLVLDGERLAAPRMRPTSAIQLTDPFA
jgi:hypothetical protein